MSWSEIKKAVNSDLDTPLNELITNVKDELVRETTMGTLKTVVSTFTGSSSSFDDGYTLAEVSGSGNFYYGGLSSKAYSSSSFAYLKLYIDDELVFYRGNTNTSSLQRIKINCGFTNTNSANASNSYPVALTDLGAQASVPLAGNESLSNVQDYPNSTLVSTSTTGNTLWLPKPIRFNTSFKLLAYGYSTTYTMVAYELFE